MRPQTWRLNAVRNVSRSVRGLGLRYSAAPFHQYRTIITGLRPSKSHPWRHQSRTFTDISRGTDGNTIYALSTAPGRAAIAIIRISGSLCLPIYSVLCPGHQSPRPRRAIVRSIHAPETKETLDSNSLVLFFPGPRSVTGEDVLELHVHGGSAIVASVLRAIASCNDYFDSKVRYAEAGEFSRRGFLNDRLDLTQAESLGDMLSANTEQQRRRALRGASGALAKRYEEWREELLQARGEMEALIDFSEDQQFAETPSQLVENVTKQVVALQQRVGVHIQNATRGELLKQGISVALIGKPNAGKSSLLNLVVGREAAIVSPEQGTTRDVLEVPLDLGGFLCRFVDTAGLRNQISNTDSERIGAVELEGIRRAKQQAEQADVVVVLLSYEPNSEGQLSVALDGEILDTLKQCLDNGSKVLIAINKFDLCDTVDTAGLAAIRTTLISNLTPSTEHQSAEDIPIQFLSCKQAAIINKKELDKSGLPSLLSTLIETFHSITSAISLPSSSSHLRVVDTSEWEESLGSSERQRLLLEECSSHLDSYLAQLHVEETTDSAEPMVDIVLAAESLRAAADCLARITGRGEAGDVEEVLGVVFEK